MKIIIDENFLITESEENRIKKALFQVFQKPDEQEVLWELEELYSNNQFLFCEKLTDFLIQTGVKGIVYLHKLCYENGNNELLSFFENLVLNEDFLNELHKIIKKEYSISLCFVAITIVCLLGLFVCFLINNRLMLAGDLVILLISFLLTCYILSKLVIKSRKSFEKYFEKAQNQTNEEKITQ